MNQIKGLLAQIQNPTLRRSLIENPQGLVQLAGLNEDQLKKLNGLGKAVSAMIGHLGGQNGTTPPGQVAKVRSAALLPASGSRRAGEQGVPVVAVVSLLAVAGAVTAVGLVSLVALVGDRDDQRI